MIYNIFRSEIRNPEPKLKQLIIADVHEKNSLVISELCKSAQIVLKIKSLEVADYIINNVAVERKTVSDLINSMINKRLTPQLNQLKLYEKPLLIVEGDLDKIIKEESDLSNALRGLLISVTTNLQIPVVRTGDYKDTAKYLEILARQQSKPKTEISLHSRIPKTKGEQKNYILQSFPNVGPIKANKLLERFKTIKEVVNAEEEDLIPILKSKTKEFSELLKY